MFTIQYGSRVVDQRLDSGVGAGRNVYDILTWLLNPRYLEFKC